MKIDFVYKKEKQWTVKTKKVKNEIAIKQGHNEMRLRTERSGRGECKEGQTGREKAVGTKLLSNSAITEKKTRQIVNSGIGWVVFMGK